MDETMSKTPGKNGDKQSYTDKIAEKVIAALEDGTAPWIRPWTGGELASNMPINPVTMKRYSGINFLNLSMVQASNGYTDSRWLTYKQAAGIGAQVRQGEKGTTIQYWKFSEEVDKVDENGRKVFGEDGKPEKETIQLENPKVFYSTVFNGSQIDNMPQRVFDNRPERMFEAIEAAERIIENSGANISHIEGAGAYYRPRTDDIVLPVKSQFNKEMGYYSTALHELGHWTGHPSRLDRDLSNSFGTQGYAKEELRAEISSYMLCSELGVDFDPSNHHAYIKSWVKNLQEAPTEIFKAAADAGKITQFLQGFNMEMKQEQSISPEQKELLDRLALSTLTPGVYTPSEAVKTNMHVAVFAGEKPLILTGSFDDKSSIEQAHSLAKSPVFKRLVEKSGYTGALHVGDIHGNQIEWGEKLSAVIAKESGKIETGQEKGDLMAIILADDLPLATVMCVDSEIAKAIDPLSPLPTAQEFNYPTHDVYEEAERVEAIDKEIDHHKDAAVSEVKRRTELGRFDETDFGSRVDKAAYNTVKIPLENVEDAIARYGTIRLDNTDMKNIIFAELEIEGEKYILNTNPKYAAITPRDKWNDTLFEDISYSATVLTHLTPNAPAQELESSVFPDFQALKEYTKELNAQYPNFVVTQAVSMTNSSLYSNYMMADKELTEIKYLHITHDGKQEWESISPDVAKQRLEKAYYPQIVKEWGLDKIQDQSSELELKAPPKVFNEKTFLSVAYSEKDFAKHHGAKWDKEEKLWYAPAGTARDKLERFVPENKETKALADSMAPMDQNDVLTQFKQALEDRGLIIDGDPIMDGKMHRVPVDGDKHPERKNGGAYIGYTDGRPSGFIQNFVADTKDKWTARGEWQSTTPEQAEAQRAKMAQNKTDRENERKEEHETVSIKVRTDFKEAREATNDHPYLKEKGVEAHGLKLDARGNLLMPLQDVEGKIWSAQHIGIKGYKQLEPGGKKEGNFFIIGASSIEDVKTAVICEGYATGASIHEAINAPVIVAIDAGNIANVAKAINEKFPDKAIVIAADNDIQREQAGKDNVGRLKAEAAAEASKGVFIAPRFTPEEVAKGSTDFNDLAKSRGLDEVKKQLMIAIDKTKSQESGKAKELEQGKNNTQQRELKRQVTRQTSLNM